MTILLFVGIVLLGPREHVQDSDLVLDVTVGLLSVPWDVDAIQLLKQSLEGPGVHLIIDWDNSSAACLQKIGMRGFKKLCVVTAELGAFTCRFL